MHLNKVRVLMALVELNILGSTLCLKTGEKIGFVGLR